MIERCIEYIMIHTDIFDAINKSTNNLIVAMKNDDVDKIEFFIDNRDHVINLSKEVYSRIESFINNLPQEELTKENIEIIKSWSFDLSDQINSVQAKDNEIIEMLNEMKTNVGKEIGDIYKISQKFKGYNLNNVK
ncbi:MAG: hypothetical protein GY909_12090 [Oligoflexia bacterium]|nr:hypothetical protein [Oligoflexia bacterium]